MSRPPAARQATPPPQSTPTLYKPHRGEQSHGPSLQNVFFFFEIKIEIPTILGSSNPVFHIVKQKGGNKCATSVVERVGGGQRCSELSPPTIYDEQKTYSK